MTHYKIDIMNSHFIFYKYWDFAHSIWNAFENQNTPWVLKFVLKSVFIFRNRPKIASLGKIKTDLAFAFEVLRGALPFK